MSSGKSRKQALKLLKGRFDPDHVFLQRDDEHAVPRNRHEARTSDLSLAGTAPARPDSAGVDWREYRWSEECVVGEAVWTHVRWRFYANGRIAFQAEMENGAGNMRLGSLQGHRIELQSADGCLLGAWKAAFFVRRNSGIRHYPATVVDEHPLLAWHFEELADTQSGIYYRA